MASEVLLTDDAVRDLEEIDSYIRTHDSPQRADHVLNRLQETLNSVAEFPDRGSHPNELLELGIRDYREVFFKPYRIIYRVLGDEVYVYLIADGRRDMQTLLSRRLLSV